MLSQTICSKLLIREPGFAVATLAAFALFADLATAEVVDEGLDTAVFPMVALGATGLMPPDVVPDGAGAVLETGLLAMVLRVGGGPEGCCGGRAVLLLPAGAVEAQVLFLSQSWMNCSSFAVAEVVPLGAALKLVITHRRLVGARRASSSFVLVASSFHFWMKPAICLSSADGPAPSFAAATMAALGAVFGGAGFMSVLMTGFFNSDVAVEDAVGFRADNLAEDDDAVACLVARGLAMPLLIGTIRLATAAAVVGVAADPRAPPALNPRARDDTRSVGRGGILT